MLSHWISRGASALVVFAGTGWFLAGQAAASPVGDAAALRAAVSSVNGTGPAAEIELVPGTTYTLGTTDGCADEDANRSGDLDIERLNDLKIFTPDGHPPAVIETACDPATSPQRVMDFASPDKINFVTGTLTLSNLIIRNGYAPAGARNNGGGVASLGRVIVQSTRFENNSAGKGMPGTAQQRDGSLGGNGGAIDALGKVTVEGSTFTGNRAGEGGGGYSFDPVGGTCTDEWLGGQGGNGGDGGMGGAIHSSAGLTVENSTFIGNHAGLGGNGGDGGCGGGWGGPAGTGGDGGAVACGSVFRDQRPRICGSPMSIRGSTFSANGSGDGGKGGNGGEGNPGDLGGRGGSGCCGSIGGAILQMGEDQSYGGPALTVDNSTFDNNTSGNGAAGGNGGKGGDGTAAGLPPGKGGNGGDGGPGGKSGAISAVSVINPGSTARLTHVTAVGNNGGGAGGAGGKAGENGRAVTNPAGADTAADPTPGRPGDRGGRSFTMEGWTSIATVVGGSGESCWNPATTASFSLSTDDSCGFGAGTTASLQAFALAPLAENGGMTHTRLPGAGSVLIDKVTTIALPVDQRGVARPQNAAADIGAVEVKAEPQSPQPPGTLPVTGRSAITSVVAGAALALLGWFLLVATRRRRRSDGLG